MDQSWNQTPGSVNGLEKSYVRNRTKSPPPNPPTTNVGARQRKYGFCFVKGVPATPEATKEVVERISHIKHTHYGSTTPSNIPSTYRLTVATQ